MEYLIEFLYNLLQFLPRFKTISPDKGAVILRFGRYVTTLYGGRYRFYWPIITKILTISISTNKVDLPNQTLTAQNGKTYVINGSVFYRITSPKIALLNNVDVAGNLQEDAMNAFRLAVSASAVLNCEDIIEDVVNDLDEAKIKYGIEIIDVNVAEYATVIPIRNICN
ncbi:hypothetical protein LCGC14_0376380 [marine sediment metagenome]|uniref:Band 7 domain-containing protein n=1 Tax=marine sediment metagenome TaxID=412755 RepID=A0A0F9T3W9_9ZZZZ